VFNCDVDDVLMILLLVIFFSMFDMFEYLYVWFGSRCVCRAPVCFQLT